MLYGGSVGGLPTKVDLMKAMRALVLLDAPRGPLRLDAYGNVIDNIYVRRVDRVGGKLQNAVIYSFSNISQFWEYDPENFLKQPVYSRDFPPCKFC